MLYLIPPIFAILLLALFFASVCRVNAAFAPLMACGSILLFMLLGGGLGILIIARVLCCLAIMALAAYAIVKSPRAVLAAFLQPGILAFLLGALSLCVLFTANGSFYTHWDEYSHWGTSFKIVYEYDAVYQHTTLNFLTHATYPQGTASFYYFLALFAPAFRESDSFVAMAVLMVSACVPLLATLDWKKPVAAVLGILAAPLFLVLFPQTSPFSTVMQDALLGALWGSMLLAVVLPPESMGQKARTAVLAVAAAATSCVKSTGAYVALGILLLYALSLLLQKPQPRRWYLHPLAGAGAVAASLAFWRVVLLLTGFAQDKFSASEARPFFASLLAGLRGEDDDFVATVWGVFRSNIKRTGVMVGRYTTTLVLGAALVAIAVAVGLWLWRKKGRRAVAVTLWSTPFVVGGYMVFLFYTYVSRMNLEEAVSNSHFYRYTSCIFIMWVMLTVGVLVYWLPALWRHAATTAFAALVVLEGSVLVTQDVLGLTYDYDRDRGGFYDVSGQMLAHLAPDEDVWLLAFNGSGEMYRFMFGYSLLPARVSTSLPWQFSQDEIPPEEMAETARAAGTEYILVYEVDEAYRQAYSHLYSDELQTILETVQPCLYRVTDAAIPFELVAATTLD